MMSARNERIRAFGGPRGAKPTGVLMSAGAIKHAIGRHASEERASARFFYGARFVLADYLRQGLSVRLSVAECTIIVQTRMKWI
jgi:hypothetical protein